MDSGASKSGRREKDIAWHARGGNTSSVGVELAGFARQTPDDWADAYSTAGLRRAATFVADVCRRKRIPVRWLLAGDLVAGRRGITGHVEVSRAYRKSDHCPAPGFPIEASSDVCAPRRLRQHAPGGGSHRRSLRTAHVQLRRRSRRLQGCAPPKAGIRAAGIRSCGFLLRGQITARA
jgi:hypothetical protein